MELIDNNIETIHQLCSKYNVNKLFIFGSILTKEFRSDSDIDFVVDFDRVELMNYADNYYDFKFSLENIFGREVDLLEQKAIKNPYLKKSINSTKKLIYG